MTYLSWGNFYLLTNILNVAIAQAIKSNQLSAFVFVDNPEQDRRPPSPRGDTNVPHSSAGMTYQGPSGSHMSSSVPHRDLQDEYHSSERIVTSQSALTPGTVTQTHTGSQAGIRQVNKDTSKMYLFIL